MKKPLRNDKAGTPSSEQPIMELDPHGQDFQGMVWRVERLERQIGKLSELIREHAVDADRLVQIVAEDRELLHQELTLRLAMTRKEKKASPASSTSIELFSS